MWNSLRRTFKFPSIDYNHNGSKRNRVSLDVEIRKRNGYFEFSSSGTVWGGGSGQMLDDVVAYYKDNPTYMKIFGWWQKYHIKRGTPPEVIGEMLGFLSEPEHTGTIGSSAPPSPQEVLEFVFRDRDPL